MLPITDLGRWWAALLFGLMLLFALLIGAWLLRVVMPAAPAFTLSAMERAAPFSATPGASDSTQALKASLDGARDLERKLRAELASRQDDLKRRLEQCRPAGPALPAERWAKGDLATLKGCWVLGRDVPMVRHFGDGRNEQVTIKAGKICFDDQGSGFHEQVTVGPTDRWNCKAPMTAKFWSNGTLIANQPDVFCEGGPTMRWAATQLTCRRQNDDMALCQATDKSGRTQVEFRREP